MPSSSNSRKANQLELLQQTVMPLSNLLKRKYQILGKVPNSIHVQVVEEITLAVLVIFVILSVIAVGRLATYRKFVDQLQQLYNHLINLSQQW